MRPFTSSFDFFKWSLLCKFILSHRPLSSQITNSIVRHNFYSSFLNRIHACIDFFVRQPLFCLATSCQKRLDERDFYRNESRGVDRIGVGKDFLAFPGHHLIQLSLFFTRKKFDGSNLIMDVGGVYLPVQILPLVFS
ncbi:hypothetical protein TNCT_619761 [Trichonephila clavata]|uniref:Uncharacterized protein n=1 Tax=Trichonephila clavata TaxID=2740835 RepID=A0A8X6GJ70_TRICU|nr:hypothetical protein TNCT_619761 [Trichonephila clavata]